MNRKFKIEIEVPIVKVKKQKNKTIIPIRFNVKGMKKRILRDFETKEQQDLCREYAKYHIMDMAKVKTYPLDK